MSRLTRLTSILLQLQSKRVVTSQDLADKFNISQRTVYRDIKALEEAGVPLIGEPGTGYSLIEGYRLPPVMFSKEEAIAFLTAEKLVEKLTDAATYQVYQSALTKIKAVLRSDEKEHLESMYEHIAVVDNPYLPKDNINTNHIQVILKSITQKSVIEISYFANHTQENTNRKIEAVGIFFTSNNWYLIAYCWLRKEYRTFRMDRILEIHYTSLEFKKQHPPLTSYLNDIAKEHKDLKEVIILVNKSAMKYFGEQKYYNGFVSEKEVNGKVEMTFLTSSIEGFARWYMMFGDCAEIASPKELKVRIKELANTILKQQ